MKRCAAKPYEGQDKYIFVSYCHKDRAYVFPVIEQLTKDGYHVWYDEGIDPGSEWPEIIAKHLNGSAICIAFITVNSLNSHNCRREINFALLKKKYFISVILEPVQLSLGMEMQLSSAQSIFKYTLSSEKEFFSKLYAAKELEKCKGSPNYSIEVSTPSDYLSGTNNFDKARDPFSDRWFAQGDAKVKIDTEEGDHKAAEDEERRKAEEVARKAAEDEERRKAEEVARKAVEEEARRKAEEAARKTVEEEARRKAEEAARKAAEKEERRKVDESDRTFAKAAEQNGEIKPSVSTYTHILKRMKTNESVRVIFSPFKIGRSKDDDNYVILDNCFISRSHAMLVVKKDSCYIVDNHSRNRTFINGSSIVPAVEYILNDGDDVVLANEKFTYLKQKK